MNTLLILSFFTLVILTVPMAFSMGGAVFIYLFNQTKVAIEVLPQRLFVTCDSFTLLAIPLFIMAGDLMNAGGLTRRIVRLSSALVGHKRGSLAHVTVLGSMMFAAMSGSAVAACSSMGSMLIPEMEKRKYDKGFAASVTACAAVIGPIIPPSIAFVIYASISGDSVGKLFMGGIIPGVLLGLCLMVISYIIAKKRNYPVEEKASKRERWLAFKDSILAMITPIIIIGGILSGQFTATEAGAVATLYALLIGFFVYRELSIKKFLKVLLSTARSTAVIIFIMANASAFSWVLTTLQMPQKLSAFMLSISTNPPVIMLLSILLLLFLGCFVVDSALPPMLAPLFIPVIKQLGIDPIHFGVVFSMACLYGAVTPPVGNLLFFAADISKTPATTVMKEIIPFVIAMLIALLLCAFIPCIVTFIPNTFM